MPQTEAQRKWYQENKERLQKKARNRYAKKREEINTQRKETREQNKKIINEARRERYQNDDDYKQRQKEIAKKSREKNKDKIAKRVKEWTDKNKEKINQQQKERRSKDPGFAVKQNLRSRMNKAIKGIAAKSKRTMELLGCSIEELIKHFESKFEKGMTMANYGEWHIDHIKPCAAFDLTKEEEQKKCFHYTNLQPLWAKDNITKSDKYDTETY